MIARRSWKFSDGLWLVALPALAVVATWPIWHDIIYLATKDDEQSHILLTPLIVAWLIWVRRARFRLCKPAPSILGPAVIGLGWALTWFGFTNSVDIARHLGAILALIGSVLAVLGPGVFMKFLPAVVTLMFMLPAPGRIRQPIASHLQQYTAATTQWILDLFALPLTREGNLLVINGHQVAVAEACNGMRMVSALGLVTFAFVFSFPMRNSARFIILACSPIIALVVNVIRLIPTVLMYGYADSDLANFVHDISGWIMLFVGLGILWLILGLLRWLQVPITRYAMAGGGAA
jgi:exosortase